MFFQGRLTDLATLSHLRDELAGCQKMNQAVQDFMRAWGTVSAKRNPAQMLDQASVPWFVELNRSLQDMQDDTAFREQLRGAARRLRMLATEIAERGRGDHPALDASALRGAIVAAGGLLHGESPMLFPAPAEVGEVAESA